MPAHVTRQMRVCVCMLRGYNIDVLTAVGRLIIVVAQQCHDMGRVWNFVGLISGAKMVHESALHYSSCHISHNTTPVLSSTLLAPPIFAFNTANA